MQTAEFQHRLPGGAHALVRSWTPGAAPRGIVQVIHGMAEHSARYARLGAALAEAGFAVFAHDLPGHGPQCEPGMRGHFADRRGWRVAIASVREIQRVAQRAHPGRPHFALGHSMGGYLLQHYVVDAGAGLAGAIFSACSGDLGASRRLALALIRAERALYGVRHPSAVGEALSFRTFNRGFKPARTKFDWLSRDPKEVDKYVADPHCGYRVSTGLWIELLTAGSWLTEAHRVRRIPRTLPVLIIGGERDPATGGAAGLVALERKYQQAGLRDLRVKVYPDARHELLNDTCRDEVTADLVSWLEARTPKPG